MSNEQYLIGSYFIVAALVLVLGAAVYGALHQAFNGITRTFRSSYLGFIFRRLFPIGILLPALGGFLSVDYRACGGTYAKVVASRSYLMDKNEEQIRAACVFLVVALCVWGIVVLTAIATQKGKTPSAGQP